MAEVSYEFLKFGAIGQIPLDEVPYDETGKYRFWRVASLAKIALNIDDGSPALNAGDNGDPTIFFFDNHSSPLGARNMATMWADSSMLAHQVQLTASDTDRLLETHRIPFKKQFLPKVIFALDEKYNDLVLPPNTDNPTVLGVDLHRFFGLEDIDSHSRGVIEEILGL